MNSQEDNLSKLKKLCQELTDRDAQLKINARALWDLLDIIRDVSLSLESLAEKDKCCSSDIISCNESLKEAISIISTRGCKKVEDE